MNGLVGWNAPELTADYIFKSARCTQYTSQMPWAVSNQDRSDIEMFLNVLKWLQASVYFSHWYSWSNSLITLKMKRYIMINGLWKAPFQITGTVTPLTTVQITQMEAINFWTLKVPRSWHKTNWCWWNGSVRVLLGIK